MTKVYLPLTVMSPIADSTNVRDGGVIDTIGGAEREMLP
jgi:hypothetical protein